MNPELLPPDERFWQRYSRNLELPLSGAVSFTLHIVTLGLMLIGVLSLFGDKDKNFVPIDLITIDEPSGQSGKDTEPLRGVTPTGDVAGVVENRIDQPALNDTAVKPEPPKPPTVSLPNENGDAEVPNPKEPRPLPKLTPLLKGSPDGTTTKGTGSRGAGPGSKAGRILTEKEKRQYRWTMLFRTSDIRDYIRQLQALGAILGVQYHDKSLALIKDLSQRPVELQSATQHPDRIFWMDDSPQSIAAMTLELQLPQAPMRIIAYFPASLEQALVEKELAFGRRFGRNTEQAIKETKFQITFRGGKANIEVVEQR